MRTFLRFGFLLLVFTIGFSSLALSQKKEGDKYYENGQYAKALKFYNLYDKISKRDETLIRRAICHYHVGNPTKTLFDLNVAEKLGNKSEELHFYRAKSFGVLGRYVDAAESYKVLLKNMKKSNPMRQDIVNAIRQCGYARNFILKDQIGRAANLGDEINTTADEERLVESVNYVEKIYFTSNRINTTDNTTPAALLEFNDNFNRKKDIYTSSQTQNRWSEVENFNLRLNTNKDEKLWDFSNDGTVVFFESGTNQDDKWLLIDTAKVDNEQSISARFVSDINVARGDRDIRVVNDSIIIFASNSLPGFGGYDLYYITRGQNGNWSKAKNFGIAINTEADEISPYLSRNGKKLYFSSSRIYGLGDLDIYSSVYRNNRWSSPRNMGNGINSTLRDVDFVFSRAGDKAYLTSNRLGGNGGKDLYRVDFLQQDTNNLSTLVDVSFFKFEEIQEEQYVELKATYTPNTTPNTIPDEQPNNPVVVTDPKPVANQEEPVVTAEAKAKPTQSESIEVEVYDPEPRVVDQSNADPIVVAPETIVVETEIKKASTEIIVDNTPDPVQNMEGVADTEEAIIVEEEVIPEPIEVEVVTTPKIKPRPIPYEEPVFQVDLDLPPVELPKKEIIIEPLLYDEDENIITDLNLGILRRIASGLELDPDLKVVIVSHGLAEGDKGFDLFFSAKRGEQVLLELRKLGVKERNIKLIGVGSNYPLVKEISQGKKVRLAEKYNRRMDIKVYHSKDARVSFFHKDPIVADYLRDFKYATYQDASEGLSYRVRVQESSSIMEDSPLVQYSDLVIEKVGKKYRYTLGMFKTFKECKKLYDLLSSYGFAGIQILPYENNILIPSERLPLRIEPHNDLINFINYRLGQ